MEDTNRIEQLLIDWEAARERGENLTAEELCKDSPHLVSQIQPQIRVLQRMYGMLDQPAIDQHGPPNTLHWPGIPNYEFIAHIGSGGMGVVFKARDNSLGRDVAIKTIAGLGTTNVNDDRFRIEAEAVAQLKHPGIVQVYGYGHHQLQPYIVMEFVEGCTLRDKLDGSPIKPRVAAQLIEIIARAIQAAHSKGIVHRDLKPANILLQSNVNSGPKSASAKTIAGDSTINISEILPKWEDCEVKITDFGIAKRLDDEISATLTGEVIGTPNYMAPEQAAGLPYAVGPQTDIHAIGAILFELLTGHPPFAAPSVLETLQLVKETQPVDPRRLQPGIPVDLATICLKCLEKQTERRYASANDLADDLQRFLAGKSITARPAGKLEKIWRWCRRNPIVAGLSTALLIAMSCGVIGILWNWQHAVQSNQRAEANLENARNVIDEYFTLVSEETLLEQPGFHDLRDKLLNSALDYYEQLIENNSDNPELLADKAGAHAKVAHISAVVGKLEKARTNYEIAIELYEFLAERDVEDPTKTIKQLKLRGEYANVLLRMGVENKARVEVKAVIELSEALTPLSLDDQQIGLVLVNAFRLLGVLYNLEGEVRSSELAYKSAMEHAQTLVDAESTNANYRLLLARTNESLGQLNFHRGSWDEAQSYYEQAMTQLDLATNESTNILTLGFEKANALNDYAKLLIARGKFDRAFDLLDEANTVATDLIRLNPKVLEFKNLGGIVLHNLGLASLKLGKIDKATYFLNESLLLRQSIIETNKKSHAFQSDYASTLNTLASVESHDGNFALAEKYLQNSVEILKKLNGKHPEITEYKFLLATVTGNLNSIRLNMGKTKGSIESQEKAIENIQALLEVQPNAPEYLRISWSNKLVLANIYSQLGQTNEAKQVISGFSDFGNQQDSPLTESYEQNRKLVRLILKLSSLQFETGDSKSALKTILDAIRLAQANADTFTRSSECKHDLKKCFLTLARFQVNANKLKDANKNIEQAMEMNAELIARDPGRSLYMYSSAFAFYLRARVHEKSKDYDLSIGDGMQSIAILNDLIDKHPDRIKFIQMLAKTETNLGNAFYAIKENKQAMEYLQSADKRWRLLTEKSLRSDEAKTYHAVCLFNLANVYRTESRFKEAKLKYDQSIEYAQSVISKRPDEKRARTCLSLSAWGRARTNNFLTQYAAAADDWQLALQTGSKNYDLLFRMERAWSLSMAGKPQLAFDEAREIAKRHDDGNGTFIAARLVGQAINALEANSEFSDEQKRELLERYQDQTMKWLKDAKELNVFESPQMRSILKTHGDFAGMRRFEPFRSFSTALD